MTNNSEVIHVSRALKMHGLSHDVENTSDHEYDCCAEIAIEAHNDFLRFQTRNKNEIKSALLN